MYNLSIKTVRLKKILLISAVVLLIFLVTLLILPQSLSAFSLFKPFGGMVILTIPCTCSVGTLLVVGPPRGGLYILTPASRVYAKYSPISGRWVLGLAGAPLVCMVVIPTIPPSCVPAGSGPAIIMTGTS